MIFHLFPAIMAMVKLDTYTELACTNETRVQKNEPKIQSLSMMSTTVKGMLKVVMIKSEMASTPIRTLVELESNRF